MCCEKSFAVTDSPCVTEVTDGEEEIVVVALLTEEKEENKKKKRSMCVHPINERRANLGQFHHLLNDLKEDEKKFFQYEL